MSTFRIFATSDSLSIGGCILLVHQREIVDGFICNFSANHLLLLFFSAKITLILLVAFFVILIA